MAPLKIGILGVQHYHSNFWARAFNQSEKAEVVGFSGAGGFTGRYVLTNAWRPFVFRTSTILSPRATPWRFAPRLSTISHLFMRLLCTKRRCCVEEPLSRLRLPPDQRRCGAVRHCLHAKLPKRFDPVNHEILSLSVPALSARSQCAGYGTVTATVWADSFIKLGS